MTRPRSPTRKELADNVKLTERMAKQSEVYFRKDPAQKRGALLARSRARDAKLQLANFDALAAPQTPPPSIDVLLTYDKLAGDIATIAFLLRCGEADEVAQKNASIKLACLAVEVRKIETNNGRSADV